MSVVAESRTAQSWQLDEAHSRIGFAVKHLGVSTFRGNFADASGTIETDAGRIRRIEGTVQIASVVTREPQLAGHLQSADFFDAENHPTATFRSTAVTQSDDGSLEIAGELTLRGVTKPVQLRGAVAEAVDPYGTEKLAIEARGHIDRIAFGVSWNVPLSNGVLTVAERVALELDVQAVKAS